MQHILTKLGMIAALLLSFLPVSAYDFEVDGIYYNITSMSNLEVGVTHSYKWDPTNDDNTSYSGDVVIPATVNYNNRTYTVTSILPDAMGGNFGSPVTTVTMPNTITMIGSYAFFKCTRLALCPFPPSIEIIGYSAFARTALTEAHIPNGVTLIVDEAFSQCTKLRSVVIGNNVPTIGERAFWNCSSLLEVFFTSPTPPGIGSDAFFGTHSGLEKYVPSVAAYGFGKEYISFGNNTFTYTGQPHAIEWTNNLKAYKCEISEAETQVNAGTYTQNLKATYSDGVDLTIEIPYTYTINKAPLTLSVNDAQREYGDPNPAFTCDISGFVNGENVQSLGVTPSYECEANALSNVGTYRILASLEAPNYEITYNYGTLSVSKAPISVGVVNATRLYGDNNPAYFKLSYNGLKNGEMEPEWDMTPAISTAANRASGVGEYPVTVSGGKAKNYDITSYFPGTLTVTKRNLTAKANDCERLYGEKNPAFHVSYLGFVNNDNESSLTSAPVAECAATKESNAGRYPITVNGGAADNYNFVYQDGKLTIKPLTVGFKDVFNSVTYNDMNVSTDEKNFRFIPKIVGPYNEDDFWLEMWFLDKDNKYTDHIATISGGDYAGNYVNLYSNGTMYAGKYIFNLTSKGTNPNVTANPSRAYLTINRTSTNLEWKADSPIVVGVGEKVDLGITYQADLWCNFITYYDEELIEVTSEGATGKTPHWYATGLKEGETALAFNIECKKNDLGCYDFSDSPRLSKVIKVVDNGAGVNGISNDASAISIKAVNGKIIISGKNKDSLVRVFNLQGALISETEEDEITNLLSGAYIVTVDDKATKVLL